MKLFYLIMLLGLCSEMSLAQERTSSLPYSFRENNGQITEPGGKPRADIDFSLQAPGMSLMVGDAQMHYQFSRPEGGATPDSLLRLRRQVAPYGSKPPLTPDGKPIYRVPNTIFYRLDVTLLGANKQAQIVKEEERTETFRYYDKGSKQQSVKTVKAYGCIIYKDIYPHVDWVLYTGGKEFKYDFIVHPGGKVSDIKMQYGGADSLYIGSSGALHIATPAAAIREQAPVAYMQGSHDTVAVAFSLKKNTVGFMAPQTRGTLVIDPGVDWATYAGGPGGGSIAAIATDQRGYVYLTGGTNTSANFITSGAYQASISSNTLASAFIFKMNSSGSLIWGTYISGLGDGPWSAGPYTQANDITCDAYGHVYITGITWCDAGIATPGSFQSAYSLNPGGFFGPFLMQFTDQGQLKWGTYYGASTSSVGFSAIACDKQGNIYAGGYADSTTSTTNELISAGAWQGTFGGGVSSPGYYNDALLVKFDSSGNRLWATYYGGTGNDGINAIACDSTGAVYVTGNTNSPDNIGTSGTFQPQCDTSYLYTSINHPEQGGFVAKFSATGQRVWGSYVNALGHGISINGYGQLYVSGAVNTSVDTMIASSGAFMTMALSDRGDFLMRFNAVTGQRVWGTYYTGEFQSGYNVGNVSCDSFGNVFLSGPTNSRGAPGSYYVMATPDSHQDSLNAPYGVFNPNSDVYIAMFDSTGRRKWGTYYGGSGIEYVGRSAVDRSSGAIYLCGYTTSDDAIATAGSFQPLADQTNGPGSAQGFLVKFMPLDISLDSLITPIGDTLCSATAPLSVRVRNKGKMTKTDPLVVVYKLTGPVNANGSQTFSTPMAPGANQVLSLGNLDLNTPGDYDLTVYLHYTRDDNDFDNDTLHYHKLVVAPPSASFSRFFNGNTYHFSSDDTQPGNSYQWELGDGGTSDQATVTHTYPDKDSSYVVVLTVTNACGSATDSVRIQTDGPPTGIDEAALVRSLNIYPNPARSDVRIESLSDLILRAFLLTDAAGTTVSKGTLKGKAGSIHLEAVPAGVYLQQVQTSKGMVRKKLTVIK